MKDPVELYNDLHREGAFDFVPLEQLELPATTREYLNMVVLELGYQVQVHRQPEGGVYLFQINHPVVRYLMYDPAGKGRHMWGNRRFDNLDNNMAIAMLAAKTPTPARPSMSQSFLKCEVRPGMFSDERVVIVRRAEGETASFFVPRSAVNEGRSLVRVNIHREDAGTLVASIPTVDGGAFVPVRSDDVER